jgi:hypothetical protein
MKLEFLDRFLKNTQIPNITNIRLLGAELFHADGETDMTKLTDALHNSVNAPKIRCLFLAVHQMSHVQYRLWCPVIAADIILKIKHAVFYMFN